MLKMYIDIESKNNIKKENIKLQKKYKYRIKLITASGFMLPVLCSGPTILYKCIKDGFAYDIFQTMEYVSFMSIYGGTIGYFVSKSVLKDNNKIKELEKKLTDINAQEKLNDFENITYKDKDYIKNNRKYEEYKILFKQKKD